ncbi:hypothetical protein NLH55_004643 [Escherichia coli]|jgi:hypothetical protein|uniref:hypothetical protein n=1 Tax=Enterobacteriaceae TaxID=543 RepID=UPI000E214504|nr:hypothetical protein [Escherichia coli]EKG4013667.1 hypothetical protein [Shigella sonnei]HCR8203505.1 hypothetical protein [Shigella flexneri]EEW8596744.1 hypothetical protein [Escherichia coli]EFH2851092.1 hypothetical protein [Escherichia coli]EFK2712995.1 hypothetical protein [Escherichia coli]
MTERSERMSEEAPGNRNVNGGTFASMLTAAVFAEIRSCPARIQQQNRLFFVRFSEGKKNNRAHFVHFVRFPDCQFVDCAERLRHKNGKMICSPFLWVVLWGVNGVVVFFVG